MPGTFLLPAHRPATLGLFLFFCAGFADGVLIPFFPLWAQNTAHIPTGMIGLLFACYAGGEIIAAPLIGGIADRIGRRPTLILSSFGIGCGFLSLFLIHTTLQTAIALLFTGLCESVFHPTIQTIIADIIPTPQQRSWFNLTRVSSSLGQILGPATGAALAIILKTIGTQTQGNPSHTSSSRD